MNTCVTFGGSENIPPSPGGSRETMDTCVTFGGSENIPSSPGGSRETMDTCVTFGGSENIPPSPGEARETVDTCVQRPGVVAGLQHGGWAGEHRFTRTSKAFCSLRWLLEPLTGLALKMRGTRSLDQPAKKPFGSDLSLPPASTQRTMMLVTPCLCCS